MGLADARLTLQYEHAARTARDPVEQPLDGAQLVVASERRHGLVRDLAARRGVEPPAVGEPLEAGSSAIGEPDARDRADQLAHDIRHEHLARRRLRRDARRRAHRLTDRIIIRSGDLAGVDPDARRWAVPEQGALHGDGVDHRLSRCGEHQHQPVTQRLDLTPSVGLEPAPGHVEHRIDRRRTLDVAELHQQLGGAPRGRGSPR